MERNRAPRRGPDDPGRSFREFRESPGFPESRRRFRAFRAVPTECVLSERITSPGAEIVIRFRVRFGVQCLFRGGGEIPPKKNVYPLDTDSCHYNENLKCCEINFRQIAIRIVVYFESYNVLYNNMVKR